MKRYIALIIALMLILSSCGKGTEEYTTAVATEPITETDGVTTVTEEVIVPPLAAPIIELVTVKESIGSASSSTKTFIYPKVTIADNNDLTVMINREIESACANLFKRSVPGAASMVSGGSEIFYKTTECNYVLHNDKWLSVEFYVVIDIFGGVVDEMPDKAYSAITIDLETGSVMYAEKFIWDLDKLKKALLGGEFTLMNSVTLTASDLEAALVQYRADYGIYPSVYFGEGSVTVCVELAKLQGGYALYSISADKATDYFTDFIG